jgi:hypothetical protein
VGANEALQEAFKTGKVPYRYEFDVMSGVYFGLAIILVIVVHAAAISITQKILK